LIQTRSLRRRARQSVCSGVTFAQCRRTNSSDLEFFWVDEDNKIGGFALSETGEQLRIVLRLNNAMKTYTLLLVLFALALVGCSADLPPPTDDITPTVSAAQANQDNGAPSTEEVDPVQDPFPRLVKQDLAIRLSVPIHEIDLVNFTDVEWADTSLGCPQPDTMYAGVMTPGHHIVLQAEGTQYKYHTDVEGYFVLCSESGEALLPVIPIPKGDAFQADDGWPSETKDDDVVLPTARPTD
jgi:hypothetical protein